MLSGLMRVNLVCGQKLFLKGRKLRSEKNLVLHFNTNLCFSIAPTHSGLLKVKKALLNISLYPLQGMAFGVHGGISKLVGHHFSGSAKLKEKSTRPTNAPQAATFAVCSEHLSNLFGRDVAMIIQGVKPFVERLLALGAEIPLAPMRGFTMFMRVGMTT